MGMSASLVPNSKAANDTQNGSHVEPVTLTDQTFDMGTKQGIVFVDFWAPWCGPCRVVSPIIDKLAIKWQGKIKFAKINTDENPLVQMKYNIMSLPTFLLFVNGEPREMLYGAGPEPYFEQFLQANFAKYEAELKPAQPATPSATGNTGIMTEDEAMPKAA